MASLKEVKTRINSVNSTRKITSAMKMVASSKLHHAQQAIEQMRPYQRKLTSMMKAFIASLEGDIDSPLSIQRELKRVALVVYSSNSSLCGGFNSNVSKALLRQLEKYKAEGIEVLLYPIGRKVQESVKKLGFSVDPSISAVLDRPAYSPIAQLAQELTQLFLAQQVDQVDIIYHQFKSTGTQVLTTERFLPLVFATAETSVNDNFIVEPSAVSLLEQLIPKLLDLQLYSAMLDSLASEHAARVIAMQVATDNADELLRELTLQYNKTRQQAITAELLDIVGGSLQ